MAWVLDIFILGSIEDNGTNVSLYFHPPIAMSSSRKIIIPTTAPTEILFIKPFFF